jgi:cytochrome b561
MPRLMRHGVVFCVYLVSVIVYFSAHQLDDNETPRNNRIFQLASIFWAIGLMISQLFLVRIFWDLGKKVQPTTERSS